jgi:hypothetical protein
MDSKHKRESRARARTVKDAVAISRKRRSSLDSINDRPTTRLRRDQSHDGLPTRGDVMEDGDSDEDIIGDSDEKKVSKIKVYSPCS